MRAIIILVCGLTWAAVVQAQVGSSISADGSSPNDNAMLDVKSPSSGAGKGILIPRVSVNQRTNASLAVDGGLLDGSGNLRGGAAQGLIVYQTDNQQGLYFNTSSSSTPSWAYLGDISGHLASNIWAAADATTNYLPRTGGTMSGTLNMGAQIVSNVASIDFNGNNVSVGREANGSASGAAIGYQANGASNGAAVGVGALGTNNGAVLGWNANGSDYGASLGRIANGANYGAAAGYLANGADNGAAVGYQANGSDYGAALGRVANGNNYGAALGYQATGTTAGAAVGRLANGSTWGAAVGNQANAYYYGAALGYLAVSTNGGVAVGWLANGSDIGAAVGQWANGVDSGVAMGVLAKGTNYGVALGRMATGSYSGAAVGYLANGYDYGAAVGREANGSSYGAAMGWSANSASSGAALGRDANGLYLGTAVGRSATGRWYGVAMGYQANGTTNGVAIGYQAQGWSNGVAIGYLASGRDSGVAIGSGADGSQSNIAIGRNANVSQPGATNRIAIGNNVSNNSNDTVRIRGTLFLDGGDSNIYYRTTFGNGNWSNKTFEIDHPLDPQNKILRHYSLEGPQVWNVYAGNVQLVNGQATVQLPDYYSALNLVGSEIYSLTPIGGAFPVGVGQKVQGNQFVIVANQDGEVSWTIKVLRNDPGCQEDLRRRPVEQMKSELEIGK